MEPLVLAQRELVEIAGKDAADFLDRIITVDVSNLEVGGSRHGALLSPQGKILADGIFIRTGADRFLADVAQVAVSLFVQRLTQMKLRSVLTLKSLKDQFSVAIGQGGAFDYADPRPWPEKSAFRNRTLVAAQSDSGEPMGFHRARIEAGFAEMGMDFQPNERFPHDINLDQWNGVDFAKGCYVGQEVVSRMQHRGSARTRAMIAETSEGEASILAGDRLIGDCAPAVDGLAMAFVRIDRLGESEPFSMTCGGKPIRLQKPYYARWPDAIEVER